MVQSSANAIIAIVLALLPLPALKLLDDFNRGCGDGLCGFFSGLLILGGLATATFIFVMRSAWRKEKPSFLRWIPLAFGGSSVVPLFF